MLKEKKEKKGGEKMEKKEKQKKRKNMKKETEKEKETVNQSLTKISYELSKVLMQCGLAGFKVQELRLKVQELRVS